VDIRDKVDGLDSVNVYIDGDADYLDAAGNLVPGAARIVTKGTVAITEDLT